MGLLIFDRAMLVFGHVGATLTFIGISLSDSVPGAIKLLAMMIYFMWIAAFFSGVFHRALEEREREYGRQNRD